ncbi:YggS family pyridoxal phosphate enzyme [Oribacterium asaccharolyticum ACB7]|jgi:pyridoxal phosphate enzyme, yggS family|uniref:Pyridoxal phosphate homeostasis protein n=1 Tax=Oribacterium asaccharolyticum ACB7 TaxID=796944 RepID=G9WSX6_9FIRM|nr:YggS family pyridoxal phosphate-dependent enzyme [Oribacterium asaccharolyticum]EHL13346.1 YggS family pyridoxal phosphate enzyme [Oribacterium asaccharolyticum ACB7]
MQKEVELVREKIRLACDRAGRDSETVLLLGVSKTKPYSALQEAYSYGIHDFGENKVQEIRQKYEMMLEDSLMKDCPPRFHMIGTLQKNKVKYLPGKVVLIHSVDSLPLSLEIEKEYAKKETTAKILLEVNVAKEESKSGFSLEELEAVVTELAKLPHVLVCGLMTVAPFTEDAEENRPVFRALREALLSLQKKFPALPLTELSMGMSGDYEVAVEEGATIVRVGSFIFGERVYL